MKQPSNLAENENHHPCIIPSEISVTCLWACVCHRVSHMEGAALRGSFLQQRELEPLHSKQPGLWFSSARRTLQGWNHNELQDVLFVESPSKNGPQLQVLLKTIHIFIEFTAITSDLTFLLKQDVPSLYSHGHSTQASSNLYLSCTEAVWVFCTFKVMIPLSVTGTDEKPTQTLLVNRKILSSRQNRESAWRHHL